MSKVSSSNGLEKCPKLRFPGFDESLAKFEIGNACEQLKETIDPRTTPTEFYAEYSMPAFDNNRKVAKVQGKDMNSVRKVMSKPCVLINKLNVRKKRIWLVDHPEKNAVSSTEFVPLSSTMMSLGYLNYVALTDRFTNYMLNCSSGSSNSQKRVTPDDILDYVITAPSLLEQERIARFLETIDSKIRAQEDLIELLKKYKRGLLQYAFPQKGEVVPQLRFAGFSGDWERRKISDMFKVTRGYVLAATLTEENQTDEMPYPVYSSQTKDDGLMGYYKDFLYENAITWTTDGANAGTVNYRAGKFYCTNVCGVLISNEVKTSKMIAEALNNVAKNYVSYVGNPKLMNNVMADIEIMIPVSPLEQEKISNLFAVLDNLITLHQRRLDNLTKYKKGLLQQLFI